MSPSFYQQSQQVAPDSLRGAETAYDSIWASADVPTADLGGLDSIMLSDDKIFVVLAVVLLIWLGISVFILRTERRIAGLEERLEEEVRVDGTDY